jgi:hypothetical protein
MRKEKIIKVSNQYHKKIFMRKTMMMTIAIFGMLGIMFMAGSNRANAQLFSYTGSSTTSTATTADTSTASTTDMSSTASSTMMASSSGTSVAGTTSTVAVPIYVAAPPTSMAPGTPGYIQLNGLTVTSVSAAGSLPMQVLVANTAYPTLTNGNAMATSSALAVTCEQFTSDSATTGTSVTCPMPLVASTAVPTSTVTSTAPATIYYSPYTITVDAATQLLLDDRTPATFADIMPGDQVNVYGYYDGVNTINAEIIRDVSRSSATGTTSGGMTVTGGASTTAELQAELNQLETLALQLEAELGMTSSTVSSTTPLSTECPALRRQRSTNSVDPDG